MNSLSSSSSSNSNSAVVSSPFRRSGGNKNRRGAGAAVSPVGVDWSKKAMKGPTGKVASVISNVVNTFAPNACGEREIKYLNNFREHMLNSSLGAFLKLPGAGAWLCTCPTHALLNMHWYWGQVAVQNVTMQISFQNWYKHIDGGGNPSGMRVPTPTPAVRRGKSWTRVDGRWGSNTCK